MSIEKSRNYLKQFGLDSKIQEFQVSSATVELAAKAIGCNPEKIAKSLTFLVNDEPILIVTSGDKKIDNSKFKTYYKTKAKMIKASEVENLIGHDIGGVCPFGIKENVKVYLDESLKRFSQVYPASGSSNSVVKLTLEELELACKPISWVDVCK